MSDTDPAELGNEDSEFTLLLTMAALNVAESIPVPDEAGV